jgi:hypothetical protein
MLMHNMYIIGVRNLLLRVRFGVSTDISLRNWCFWDVKPCHCTGVS